MEEKNEKIKLTKKGFEQLKAITKWSATAGISGLGLSVILMISKISIIKTYLDFGGSMVNKATKLIVTYGATGLLIAVFSLLLIRFSQKAKKAIKTGDSIQLESAFSSLKFSFLFLAAITCIGLGVNIVLAIIPSLS